MKRSEETFSYDFPFKKPVPISETGFKIRIDQLLLDIVCIKRISALRAELRRISGIFGLESALIALVKRCARRSLCSAVIAEIALVYGSA